MNLEQWARNANCSNEVAEAIHYIAQGDEVLMNKIWEYPTEPQFIAIWERATKNGLVDDAGLWWGESKLSYLKQNLFKVKEI